MSSYQDRIDAVASRQGIDRVETRNILDGVFVYIQAELKDGADVSTPIGKFKRADRAARMGRNPLTGEAIQIEAKNGAKFVPSKALKEALG